MKVYNIKYEDSSGDVFCKTIQAYSEDDAISKLFNCRKVYWIILRSKTMINP